MRCVGIVQARAGSTRLPGKVLMDVGGQAMLTQVVRRLSRARRLDDIVIATTELSIDDAVAELARQLQVGVFRGSEQDVLSRYAGAAIQSRADVIIRVTADCPLLDPAIVDAVIAALVDGDAAGPVDYASNVIDRTYPRGLDVEAFFRDVLDRVNRLARSAAAREHVTHFILREHPALFRQRSIRDTVDNSDLRWTVDEPADLEMARAIVQGLGATAADVPYRDVVAWVRRHPPVSALNAHVRQKP